ncbi:MAG: hypothetical protein WCH79_13160, partial [Planctomycetia bacterium]
ALDDADSIVRGAVAWALGQWLIVGGALAPLATAALERRQPSEVDPDVRREIEAALLAIASRPRAPSEGR